MKSIKEFENLKALDALQAMLENCISCYAIEEEETLFDEELDTSYNQCSATISSFGLYSVVVGGLGCMDENASNYNSEANVQAVDQYGNLQCVYVSCDDIPEYGCIYEDGFGAFSQVFN